MKTKKPIENYVKDFVSVPQAKQITSVSSIVNDIGFDIWSFKKLIFLQNYIRPYLNIMRSRNCECFFVDLFSGCGANKIKNDSICSIGSPIISLLSGVTYVKKRGIFNRFNRWFFVEENANYINPLTKRVSETVKIINDHHQTNIVDEKNDIDIIHGDCNEKIQDIVDTIISYAHPRISVLAFIDPYKILNISWSTWEKLLSLKYVDIIFTFPLRTLHGSMQSAKIDRCLPPSLRERKDEILKMSDEEFSELYAKDIVSIVHRDIYHYGKGIPVRNRKNTELYRIEMFSHSPSSFKICDGIYDELENLDFSMLETIKEVAMGKQKCLKDILP
ncbi:MAG: three-Cys-motif partner protein TcmP [Candidatus Aenigmatarchaeota archaeon]